LRVLLQAPGREFGVKFYRGSAQFAGTQLPLENIQAAASVTRGSVIHSFLVDRDLVTAMKEDGRFSFANSKTRVVLSISDVGPLLKAMDDCVADLLESWGMSREAQAQMASPPRPVEGLQIMQDKDYPKDALDRGGVGEVQV
jgi:hypothetical protein